MLTHFRSESGNIVLMVAFMSLIAVGFFVYLSSSVLSTLQQTDNIRNAQIASFAAESAIEQSIVEYFQNPDEPAPTIEESKELCATSTDPSEALIEFFECQGGDRIGTLERSITRYKENLSGFLNRFQTTEIWLTGKENETVNTIAGIKSLKLAWNTSSVVNEKAGISVAIARWPKDTPRNIQTNHILLNPAEGTQEFEIFDFREERGVDDGSLFRTDTFNYIIFIRALDIPTHYRLTALDESKNEILIPSKQAVIQVKTVLDDKRDAGQDITRQFQVAKEIYTDYDSSFPYVRHLLD